ncbi:carbohydrate kinase family protein [archaeon]|jgi:sugar/nucleoside kinase (ribokinase family)|nr:carbohydrate kinase family protein [archaeon]MBT6183056.1 carbohydrate kinase family protein [archaeon]MBT7251467.1 carbohydrate kinase family protein [archaeon]MBT7660737.1 carbohydrate kinase family protein [archaeon]
MGKKYDIITVGSGLIDASLQTNIQEKNNFIKIPLGTKIPLDKIIFSSGGGGTNTARCASKLGMKTAFLGKIGSGYNAQIILRELKKSNVDFLGTTSKEHTGYSIILKSTNNRRTILTFKGASDMLSYNEINLKKLNTKWFHFTSMNDESFQTQKKLISFAIKNNIKISYNPGIKKINQGLGKIKKIIKNADILQMNKEEAHTLVKKAKNEKEIFKKLHKLGAKIICITNGNKKGKISNGKNIYTFKPKKITAKKSTGAGDVFAISFVSSMIKYDDIEKSIKIAIKSAQSIITQQKNTGLLSLQQILKKIKHERVNISKECW